MTSEIRKAWIIRSIVENPAALPMYITKSPQDNRVPAITRNIFSAHRFGDKRFATEYESNNYLNKDKFDDKSWEIVEIIESLILS